MCLSCSIIILAVNKLIKFNQDLKHTRRHFGRDTHSLNPKPDNTHSIIACIIAINVMGLFCGIIIFSN